MTETATATEAAQPPMPRQRHRRRWWLAIAILLLATLPLLNLALLLPWPKQRLATSVGSHLGVPMSVQRASLWPWSGLRLHGVRFGHDHDQATFLRCRQIHVSPHWRSLVTATWTIDRIELMDFELVGRQALPGQPEPPPPVPSVELQPPETWARAADPAIPTDPDGDAATDAPPPPTTAEASRLRRLLGAGRRDLEVGELVLSGGAIQIVTPGGVEQQLLRVSDALLSLSLGGDHDQGHGEGRMTVGRIDWPGGLTTSGLHADVILLPGPQLLLSGHRPGADGLHWQLQAAIGQPGTPFALEIAANDLLLADLFDQLPDWIDPRPTWINGRAVAAGLAAHPSTVQATLTGRMENLGLHAGHHLRQHLGGRADGRLDHIDLHSLGARLRLGGGALLVDDLFVKTPDGIGRSRFVVTPEGQLQGAMRLYATAELRDMILNVLGGVPWARMQPSLWQAMHIDFQGPWREPVMRFAGRPTDEWWSPLDLIRSLLDQPPPADPQPEPAIP